MAAAAGPVDKVQFNFIWEGPKGDPDFTVEKVELVFEKSTFTVPIPNDLDALINTKDENSFKDAWISCTKPFYLSEIFKIPLLFLPFFILSD